MNVDTTEEDFVRLLPHCPKHREELALALELFENGAIVPSYVARPSWWRAIYGDLPRAEIAPLRKLKKKLCDYWRKQTAQRCLPDATTSAPPTMPTATSEGHPPEPLDSLEDVVVNYDLEFDLSESVRRSRMADVLSFDLTSEVGFSTEDMRRTRMSDVLSFDLASEIGLSTTTEEQVGDDDFGTTLNPEEEQNSSSQEMVPEPAAIAHIQETRNVLTSLLERISNPSLVADISEPLARVDRLLDSGDFTVENITDALEDLNCVLRRIEDSRREVYALRPRRPVFRGRTFLGRHGTPLHHFVASVTNARHAAPHAFELSRTLQERVDRLTMRAHALRQPDLMARATAFSQVTADIQRRMRVGDISAPDAVDLLTVALRTVDSAMNDEEVITVRRPVPPRQDIRYYVNVAGADFLLDTGAFVNIAPFEMLQQPVPEIFSFTIGARAFTSTHTGYLRIGTRLYPAISGPPGLHIIGAQTLTDVRWVVGADLTMDGITIPVERRNVDSAEVCFLSELRATTVMACFIGLFCAVVGAQSLHNDWIATVHNNSTLPLSLQWGEANAQVAALPWHQRWLANRAPAPLEPLYSKLRNLLPMENMPVPNSEFSVRAGGPVVFQALNFLGDAIPPMYAKKMLHLVPKRARNFLAQQDPLECRVQYRSQSAVLGLVEFCPVRLWISGAPARRVCKCDLPWEEMITVVNSCVAERKNNIIDQLSACCRWVPEDCVRYLMGFGLIMFAAALETANRAQEEVELFPALH